MFRELFGLYEKSIILEIANIIFLPEKLVRPFWSYPQIPQRPKPEIEQQNRSKTARKKKCENYPSHKLLKN